MKILILGGCGYIGSALHTHLFNKHEITTVDKELFGNYSSENNIAKDYCHLNSGDLAQFDVVILVAAHSSVPLCEEDPQGAFDNNVRNFVNLTQKLHKQKFIYASSSCVYVDSQNKEATEDVYVKPVDMLSFTKTTIDHYVPLTNVEYYGLRFGSVNGWSPNFRSDLMINSMAMSGMKTGKVHVTNRAAFRPILGINDIVRAVAAIIDCKEDKRGIYNVASFNTQIGEIADRIGKFFEAEVVDGGETKTYDFCISSEKFSKAFNFDFYDSLESILLSIQDNSHDLDRKARRI